MAVTIHTFTTTDWEQLSGKDDRIIAYNPSGISVTMCFTSDANPPTNANILDMLDIGGFINEYTGLEDVFTWGKAAQAGAFLRVRPYGTVDPETDTQQLGQAINETRAILNGHMLDKTNSHEVTKAQVGLGNLPNAITDSINVDNSNVIASAKSVATVATTLDGHMDDKTNPHDVTKAQVGLSKVQNYSMTVQSGAIDTTDWTSYMSPAATAIAIAQLAEVAYTVPPQSVVEGKVKNRPVGWNFSECSPPTDLVTVISGKQVQVNAGLKVAFACDQKARLSSVLAAPIVFNLPPDPYQVFYIYVNLARNGTIIEAGATHIPPQTGERKEGSLSDFFSPATCTMFDESNNTIQRVYIAKAFMASQIVSSVVSVPFGGLHTLPIPNSLGQNQRYLAINPFIEPVNVLTEIFFNSTWGDPGWNDQVGVKGNIYPADPMDKLIVQTGLMGLMAPGQESGSSFGLSFATVTAPVRVRLVVSKRYK